MVGTRRAFVRAGGSAAAAFALGRAQIGNAQSPSASSQATKLIQTPVLTIGYEETGDSQGFPIILLHGFPDDVRAWDDVAPPLVKSGFRVLVPYLRGFGPTRFREAAVPRTGEQAAIGQDLIDFADALHIPRFAVAGFDWGARAGQVAAALHPAPDARNAPTQRDEARGPQGHVDIIAERRSTGCASGRSGLDTRVSMPDNPGVLRRFASRNAGACARGSRVRVRAGRDRVARGRVRAGDPGATARRGEW